MNESTSLQLVVPAQIGKASIRPDGAGSVTVRASAAWWRAMASSVQWPATALMLADIGEEHTRSGLCGVIGTTTGRPCGVDVSYEPCVHHGPGNEANRCGARTAKDSSCRWNLVARGPCTSHPDTWERIEQLRQAQQQVEEQARLDREAERIRERQERDEQARTVTCTY